jgi:sec-independent protein translocase protein TatA
MGDLGFPEILVIIIIVLLLFGPKKLPELGSSFGKAIRGFKRSMSGEDELPPAQTTTQATATATPEQEKSAPTSVS